MNASTSGGGAQDSAPEPDTYTKTKTELYRNGDGHEVWRITGTDGSLIAENVASDHDMLWLRDYHEHAHLGDRAATAAADRLEDERAER